MRGRVRRCYHLNSERAATSMTDTRAPYAYGRIVDCLPSAHGARDTFFLRYLR